VLQLIRGKRVDQVTEILDFTPKMVAKVIGKVLHSAVANAVAMEGKINIEHLRVKRAVADSGPTMKRFLPRAQGRATPLLKRTCHITIVVEGDTLIETPVTARRARRAPAETAPAEEPASPKRAPRKKAAAKSKSKSKEA